MTDLNELERLYAAATMKPHTHPVDGMEFALAIHAAFPALAAELRALREYALMDANCPCCQQTETCEDECTFKDDCPDDYPRLEAARNALQSVERARRE